MIRFSSLPLAALPRLFTLLVCALVSFSALQAQDGTVRARLQLPGGLVATGVSLAPDGGIVVATRRKSVDGQALLLRIRDGVTQTLLVSNEDLGAAPLLRADSSAVVGSWDGSLYGVTNTGVKAWAFSTGRFVGTAPSLGPDGTVYFGAADKKLHALTQAGVERWSYSTGDWIESSPVLDGAGRIFFGSWDGYAYALSPAGQLLWRTNLGCRVIGAPAILAGEAVVFTGVDGVVHALALDDGRELWNRSLGGRVETGAVIDAQHRVYAGSFSGRFQSMDGKTGAVNWVKELGGAVRSEALVRADGLVVVPTGSRLVALKPDGVTAWSLELASTICAEPLLGPGGDMIVALLDGSLVAVISASPLSSTADWPCFQRDAHRRAYSSQLPSSFFSGTAPTSGVLEAPLAQGTSTPEVKTLQAQEIVAPVAGTPEAEAPQAVASDKQVLADVVAAPRARLINLSVRGAIGTGEATPIVGFVVSGSGLMPALLRGIGPGLQPLGVDGVLADPEISLYYSGKKIGGNDNWGGAAHLSEAFARVGAFALAPGAKDAALLAELGAGGHSFLVKSAEGATGVMMMEAYDAGDGTQGHLVNLSARALAASGERSLIVGFVVQGEGAQKVLVRAIGPSLRPQGVTTAAADPSVSVYSSGKVIASNDDWALDEGAEAVATAASKIGAFGLDAASLDAGLIVELQPGAYSCVVGMKGAAEGVVLLEVYAVE